MINLISLHDFLKVTRLHNQQKVQDERGNFHTIYNLNYYWFVGYF